MRFYFDVCMDGSVYAPDTSGRCFSSAAKARAAAIRALFEVAGEDLNDDLWIVVRTDDPSIPGLRISLSFEVSWPAGRMH